MIKGDIIRLVRQMGAFTNVGEICEVVDVTQEGVISFKFGNGMHLGCMSYDEFAKYFELVEKEEIKKRGWSCWFTTWVNFIDLDNNEQKITTLCRSNGKKVQLKYDIRDNKFIRSEATCCKNDEFLLNKGVEIAKRRLIVKILKYEAEQYAKNM